MTRPDSTTRSDLAVRRFTLVAVWLPVAFAVVGVVIQLLLLPAVPETVAIHWNAAGEADGFAPAWTQPLMTVAFGLGLPLLLALSALPGLRRGDRGPSYRLMGAVAGGLSAFIVAIFTMAFAMQAGLDSGADAPTVWLPLGAGLVLGLAIGAGAWFAQPHEEMTDASTRTATPFELRPNERAMWLRTTSMTPAAAIAIVAGVIVIGLAALVAWLTGADSGLAWILTIVTFVLVVFAATTLSFHVRVDDTGLHVDSVLGIPRFRVPLADVASAARVEVNAMGEFGGWGLRVGTGRRFGVVLRNGEAIEVVRRSGKRFVVTVDDAATGAGLLEALVARAARPAGGAGTAG